MIDITVKFDPKRINRVLSQIPVMAQIAAYDSGLQPAANVVKKRASELAPSSQQTGTRRKWSAKMRAERAGVQPLKKAIKTKKVRPRGDKTPYAMAGPERPDGNVAHFISPLKKDTRRVTLWGNRSLVKPARKDNDFMKRAFDETKQQAARAFTRGVIKAVRAKLKDLGRG